MLYSQSQHFVMVLDRITFFHVALCTASCSALYKLPTLAVTGRDLPTRCICLVVWFLLKLQPPSQLGGNATAPSSSTVLCAILPQLSCQNISLMCENFINKCIYYGFQQEKRSPIVLGPIQTFSVLDRFCSKWMLARSGVQRGGRW